jgi:hypothetical protein
MSVFSTSVFDKDMVTAVKNLVAGSHEDLSNLKRLRLLARQKHAVALRKIQLAEEGLTKYVPSGAILATDANEDTVEEEFEFLNDQLDEAVVDEKTKYREKMVLEYAVMSLENPDLLPEAFKVAQFNVTPPPPTVPVRENNPLLISTSRYSPMTFPGGPGICRGPPEIPAVDPIGEPEIPAVNTSGVHVPQNPVNFLSMNEQGGFLFFGYQQMPDGMIIPVFTPKVHTTSSVPPPQLPISQTVEVNNLNRVRSPSLNSHFVDRQRSFEFLSGPQGEPLLQSTEQEHPVSMPMYSQDFRHVPNFQTSHSGQPGPQCIPLTPQARGDVHYGAGGGIYGQRHVTAMNVTNCKVRKLKSAHLLSTHFSYIERNLIEMGAGTFNTNNEFLPKSHLVEACLTLLLSSIEDVESVSQAANDMSIKNGSDWCVIRRELLHRFSRKHILKHECDKNLKLLTWKSVSEVEDFLHKASLIYHAFCDTFKDEATDIRRLVNCIVGKLPLEVAQQVISCIRQYSQAGFLNLDSSWETLLPFESVDGASVSDVIRHVARTHEEAHQLERVTGSRNANPGKFGNGQTRSDLVNFAGKSGKSTLDKSISSQAKPASWKSRPDNFDVGSWKDKYPKIVYISGPTVKKDNFSSIKIELKCDDARILSSRNGGEFMVVAYKDPSKWDQVTPNLDKYVCRDWVFKKSTF